MNNNNNNDWSWLDAFADWTIQTARYPAQIERLYLVLGLCGEVGECLNARKKMLRDGVGSEQLADELADVLWYACRMGRAFSMPIVPANITSPSDLDAKLLLLYTVASPNECPYNVDQVIGLAVSLLSDLGHDPKAVLEKKKEHLMGRHHPPQTCSAEKKGHGSTKV